MRQEPRSIHSLGLTLFRIVLYLQKNYEASTRSSCIPYTRISLLLTPLITVVYFVTTNELISLFSSHSVMSNSVTPWTAACQASLSFTISQSLLKLMFVESVMLSNHLILCHPPLLLPSIFPSIRVFSNESVLRIRWPKYWSFSFSFSPSNAYSGLIFFRIDLAVQGTLKNLL